MQACRGTAADRLVAGRLRHVPTLELVEPDAGSQQSLTALGVPCVDRTHIRRLERIGEHAHVDPAPGSASSADAPSAGHEIRRDQLELGGRVTDGRQSRVKAAPRCGSRFQRLRRIVVHQPRTAHSKSSLPSRRSVTSRVSRIARDTAPIPGRRASPRSVALSCSAVPGAAGPRIFSARIRGGAVPI